jgi:hypothetical protein
MSRRRAIEPDPNTSTNKLLLLDVESEGPSPADILNSNSFNAYALLAGVTDQLTPEVKDQLLPHSKGFVPYEIELGYDHWNACQCRSFGFDAFLR